MSEKLFKSCRVAVLFDFYRLFCAWLFSLIFLVFPFTIFVMSVILFLWRHKLDGADAINALEGIGKFGNSFADTHFCEDFNLQ